VCVSTSVCLCVCPCKGVFQRPVVPGDREAAASIAGAARESQYQHTGSVLGCCADGGRVPATVDEVRHASGHCHLTVSSPATGGASASSHGHCSHHSTETGCCPHSRFDLHVSLTALLTNSACRIEPGIVIIGIST